MIEFNTGVKTMKKTALKRFNKTIAYNLRLVALSREQTLYQLQNEIVSKFVNRKSRKISCKKPAPDDTYSYNVFIEPEVQEKAALMADNNNLTPTEIIFTALVNYAYQNNLHMSFKDKNFTKEV
ncbi:hypothetical protein EHW64_18135 [Erwinia psidii]|uniref:hypothetical protein n=1 Tax=Erwinia psidii TaxID=69224 RepID=UPI00226B4977|nr:hypothetical protein [Erwinia psidii]MCX8959375.1 hypothetical protein [Erwinia psidii]MCX8962984.1 hypothetical protein [Erwinia psidii]